MAAAARGEGGTVVDADGDDSGIGALFIVDQLVGMY